MDATELLDYAFQLSDNECPCECTMRNTAGRAYYAAYHSALPVSKRCIQVKGAGGVHKRVIDSLEEGNVAEFGGNNRKVASLAYILRGLKDIRVHADYELDEPFDKRKQDNALKQADMLIKRVAELSD